MDRAAVGDFARGAQVDRERFAVDEAALHNPDLNAKDRAKFDALMNAVEVKRAANDTADHRWLDVAEMSEGVAS